MQISQTTFSKTSAVGHKGGILVSNCLVSLTYFSRAQHLEREEGAFGGAMWNSNRDSQLSPNNEKKKEVRSELCPKWWSVMCVVNSMAQGTEDTEAQSGKEQSVQRLKNSGAAGTL